MALHGEILVSPGPKGTLHTTPHLQDASKNPTPGMARALPERPLGLAISFPIDKKKNVPRLFLHDRLELLDEHRWKKARISGNGKQSKGKEGIKTLAVPQTHKRPFRVRWRWWGRRSEERRVGKEWSVGRGR